MAEIGTRRVISYSAAAYMPCEEFGIRENQSEYASGCRWTERHLQCVWYNSSLRPEALFTDDGESVEVIDCGRWNLEAGPDFLDASLIVGKERRRITGDIEIHIRPSGWTQHRHSTDPRYSNVIAHITYFPGPRAADLPPRVLSIPLRDPLAASPRFSFDDIDLSAYPHAILPSTPRPCQLAWGDDPDRGIAILESAGRHRLDLKRRRMADLVDFCGDETQAFYESVMTALGYKQNAGPFRMLARLYPLRAWSGDKYTDYARLLGLAGMLPDVQAAKETMPFVRDLWNRWWRNPVEGAVPVSEWRLNSLRPLNHPVRRLAAAAAMFSNRSRVDEFLVRLDQAQGTATATSRACEHFIRDISDRLIEMARFGEVEPLYSLTGMPGKPVKLIGKDRAVAIVVNTIIPLLAMKSSVEGICEAIPTETISAPMRTMANRLFGRDHNPRALYATSGLRQQGLLQIFNDFCLNARSGCEGCAFAHSACKM